MLGSRRPPLRWPRRGRRLSNTNREELAMAETYEPGEVDPRTGEVQCTRHPEVTDKVQAGDHFAPCMHWGEHDRKDCMWQYV